MSYISAVQNGEKILVWERDKYDQLVVRDFKTPWYFYTLINEVDKNDIDETFTDMYGNTLVKREFNNRADFTKSKESYKMCGKLYESDIAPELKILSKYYYKKKAPNLHITAYDIETDYDPIIGFSRPVMEFDPADYQGDFERKADTPYAPINSISIYNFWENKNYLIAVPPPGVDANDIDVDAFMLSIIEIEPLDLPTTIEFVNSEKELLKRFIAIIKDSDLIFGWNSDTFDNPYVAQRIQIVLSARYFKELSFNGAHKPKYKSIEVFGEERPTIEFYGRTATDYLELYKKFSFGEKSSYKLEAIAQDELPKMRKLEYDGTLADLYVNDFPKFVRYNIRDTEILEGFESKLGFIKLANAMYHNTTGLFKHVFGTLKNTELAMINFCHYELDNIVVQDTNPSDSNETIDGAYVLDPVIGQHDNIASIDIASLYPSTIRANNNSPDTIIGQFENNNYDFELITEKSTKMITFIFDENYSANKSMTLEAYKWPAIFIKYRWSLSGYGTVFDQNKKGILPGILESWYSERKKTKALSFKYAKEAEALLDQYR